MKTKSPTPIADAVRADQMRAAILAAPPRAQRPKVDCNSMTLMDAVRRARDLNSRTYRVDLVDEQQQFVASVYVCLDERTDAAMRKAGA